MRIHRLIIQNFNGFDSKEFKFDPHFNLLVGDNATGKTTVLDALSVSVGSWFLGIKGYAKPFGIDTKGVRIVAHQHKDTYSFEKQFPSRIETLGEVMGQNLTWARELRREGGRTTSVEAQSVGNAASQAERKVRAGENITLPLICTYGTERLWFESTHRKSSRTEVHQDRLPSRLDGYRDCIDFVIQESSLRDWIRAQVSAGEQRKRETIAFRVLKETIIKCVEGAKSLYYDERYRDLIVDMKLYGHQMFKNLSDGQRIMLTLVGDLVRRATTLNPHLEDQVLEKTPGVVTIDELDLHLHPKWQRHVVHDLKMAFPSLQFIATTHSPQLIGEALPEEVILLDGHLSANPAQAFGMDSNWVLKHVMGADEQDRLVKDELSEIEKLINSFHLESAQAKVDELRAKIGSHPELVRFSARIDRFAKKAQ
ncbi:MAG TPA: AAA family ATPase [Candidatus Saccharimonadales bacterium]|nr:AAA family ATPase [Candidatus Saccharimonadales bacterium]